VKKQVRSAAGVKSELKAAARWYEKQRVGLGVELLDAADEAIERIRAHPASGSRLADMSLELAIRQVHLDRFPYLVVYLDLPEEIRILAFAHTAREPSYWRSRLP
jgi:toxin ParE1/3/4